MSRTSLSRGNTQGSDTQSPPSNGAPGELQEATVGAAQFRPASSCELVTFEAEGAGRDLFAQIRDLGILDRAGGL